MAYKELTPQEASEMLSKNPDGFEGYVADDNKFDSQILSTVVVDVDYGNKYPFICKDGVFWKHCAIAIPIPDEYEPYPEDEMPDLKRLDGVIHKALGCELTILGANASKKATCHIYISSYRWRSNKELFEDFTHLDGSPIGRKVGE